MLGEGADIERAVRKRQRSQRLQELNVNTICDSGVCLPIKIRMKRKVRFSAVVTDVINSFIDGCTSRSFLVGRGSSAGNRGGSPRVPENHVAQDLEKESKGIPDVKNPEAHAIPDQNMVETAAPFFQTDAETRKLRERVENQSQDFVQQVSQDRDNQSHDCAEDLKGNIQTESHGCTSPDLTACVHIVNGAALRSGGGIVSCINLAEEEGQP